MRRRYRWMIAALALVLAVPMLVVLYVVLFLDPNRFHDRIERAASSQLGVPLTLTGELHWSLWPLLSIESGAGAISAPLLRWAQLKVGAQWSGLWRGNFLIDRLAVEGLELNLRRDGAGRGNWASLLGSSGADSRGTVRIGKLRLSQGAVRYEDESTMAFWSAELLKVETQLEFNSSTGNLILTDPSLSVQLRGAMLPAVGMPLSLQTTHLAINTESGSLDSAPLKARIANVDVAADVNAPLQFSPLAGAGTLSVNTDSLRAAMSAFEIAAPPTFDAKVLGPLHISMQWRADDKQVEFSALGIQLDDTRLTGTARWPLDNGAPGTFELKGDAMNLDRYLRPADQPGQPFELPIEALRATPVNGVVTLDVVKVRGVTAHGARFRLQSGE
jgi:AsmA protein